jgi:hypothetical protein
MVHVLPINIRHVFNLFDEAIEGNKELLKLLILCCLACIYLPLQPPALLLKLLIHAQ